MKIVAFAGTGKTTTLIEMAKNHPDLKFLVVLYNKDAQLSAKNRFPKNTKVRTAHSLAYEKVGRRYDDRVFFRNNKPIKNKLINGSLKAQDLISKR